MPPQTHEASGGKGEWQQSKPSLQPCHYWSQGSVRKLGKHKLMVPREQQLGWKTPRGTTECEMEKWGPVTKKGEVEKEEMLPGTSWGTPHVMARAVTGATIP